MSYLTVNEVTPLNKCALRHNEAACGKRKYTISNIFIKTLNFNTRCGILITPNKVKNGNFIIKGDIVPFFGYHPICVR